MLPCVCSVIYHRGRQDVVRISVTHSAIASCATFLFLPHFDVICDLLLNRRTAKRILFVKLTKLRWFKTGQINRLYLLLLLSCIIYNNYNFNSLNVQQLIVTSLQQSSFADTHCAPTEEISLSPTNFNSILNTVADYFLEIIFLSHVV